MTKSNDELSKTANTDSNLNSMREREREKDKGDHIRKDTIFTEGTEDRLFASDFKLKVHKMKA